MEKYDTDELYNAVKFGNLREVKRLIDSGKDVNTVYGGCRTPLIIAILYGHDNIVRYFIEKGADVNAAKGIGNTPLEWAILCDNPEIIKILFAAGAKFDINNRNSVLTLLTAADGNCLNAMRCLARYGFNLNVHDDGITCLISAASAGHIKMVKLLLEYGADPMQTDMDGRYAYDYATKKKIKEILKKAMGNCCGMVTRYRVFTKSGKSANKNDLITAKKHIDIGGQIRYKDLLPLDDENFDVYFENIKYKRMPN